VREIAQREAAAVVDARTTGYNEAISWAEEFTVAGERAWAVEGTASYGRGLTAALARASEWVIEFDRPREKASKDGAKSDELDAIRAAREALGRDRLHEPRAHDGHREALRVHTVTRAGVVRARTAAINELKALVLTAPDDLRQELRHLTTKALVKRCAAFRDTPQRPVAERCARNTMRSIARRISFLTDEIAIHDTAIKQLIDEAAFARLGSAAPLPATSGQSQDRHRLNRSGDRQLNSALFVVALSRTRIHQPTRDYRDRRRSEGKTDREIRRCIKRYIARRVWRLLEHPPGLEITT
jgi:transposase